jgi:amino acid permease
MSTGDARNAPRAVTYLLIVAGVLFAVVAVIYLTRTANGLPSFFPGHLAGSSRKHSKHGVAAIALALVSWAGAWLTSGRKSTP